MSKTEITFFEKKYSHCPSCIVMRTAIEKWAADNPEEELVMTSLSAEDNISFLRENYPNHKQAPVVLMTRDGYDMVVSGRNPDILVDMLGGLDDLWEEV